MDDPRSATRPALALTMGDPAGIGADIALMAWQRRASEKLPPFAVYADIALLCQRASALGLAVAVETVASAVEASNVFAAALPVVPITLAQIPAAGAPDTAAAPAVIASIDRAVADVKSGRASAVVTNPVAKFVLKASGFAHPGHTEYLEQLARSHWPKHVSTAVMMLASDELRVVPVTIHVPLKDVPSLLTRARIGSAVRIANDALKRDFGIARPRIAVAGLNPHAGENGMLGSEDESVIAPAIAELRDDGIDVTGPHSADTMFHAAARRRYDVAIAMYHDQALIPIKTLAFDTGVNVTLGLPFVRTSPDHGTAFSIAGTGAASPSSLIAALRLAAEMSARRAAKALS